MKELPVNNGQNSSVVCCFNKSLYRQLCQQEKMIPIFSRDWWLDCVCGESKWDVLIVQEKEQIIASLPLYRPIKNVVSMPPYTQTMGPWFAQESEDTKYTTLLGRRQAICKLFLDELISYSSFLQNFHYHITDWLPFYWEGYQQTTRYTYLLKEIHNKESLWLNMNMNIRRNITKAKEKYNITVKRNIPVKDFIHIHQKTFKRQQLSTPHIATLKKIIEVCTKREQGDIWGGYDPDGKLHAAVFITWQADCSWYVAGGGDPELRGSGAHSLVLWQAILDIASYSSSFDFEGSMLPGVERFFREFGGKQTPFFTITKGKLSLLDRVRMKL